MKGFILRLATALSLLVLGQLAAAAPAPVVVLTVNGAIGPASADYVVRGIAQGEQAEAQLILLEIDTPGGLDPSMRQIIKAILASPVPVATYVAPSGARAASAGTYILYASHIAAMAPGTNLGAATPVRLGGAPGQQPAKEPEGRTEGEKGDEAEKATTQPSTKKQVNDAAAYIRGLAKLRGRNAEWAEQAVREAVSLSADEALQQRVIDYVVRDRSELLQKLDGKKINAAGQDRVLQTAGAPTVSYEPDWRSRLLAVITNPSIALLLMTIGIYGLIFEFTSPGTGVGGVVGAISLLLALYALQLLPVNYAGVALILLGLAFMVSEAFLPSFGILGLGGVVAFVVGAVILIDTDVPGYGIPLALIVAVAVISALLIGLIVTMALKSRRLAVVSGAEGMLGSIAEMLEDSTDEGWARLNGEIWRVATKRPVERGQKVRVVGRQGLHLEVEPYDNKGEPQ